MKDDASRLLSVTTATPETYTYDLLGNRTSQHDIEGAWQYNELNELLGYADVSYEYDDNGNLTHIKRDDEVVWTYIYDAANRMVHAEDGTGSIKADYLYDPFGRRLRKEVDKNGIATTTYFLYADEGLIGEFSESGTPLRVYGYLPGTSTPLFLNQNGEYSWYRTDRLGIPHTLAASNGTVVWSGAYDAFGNCEVGVDTVESHLRLPGQYYDAETGLSYNLNRYYNPKIGRYLQPDPAGDGLNPYTYVGGNPVNAIDPLGLCALRQTRAWGGLRAIGGGADIWAGIGLIGGALSGPPGWLAVGAGIVGGLTVLNGADNLIAGGRSAISGEYTRSFGEAVIHRYVQNDLAADLLYTSSQLLLGYAGIQAERTSQIGKAFTKSVRSVQYGNDRLFYSGVQQQRASLIVQEAAQAAGVTLGNYVDDVVFLTGKYPFFSMVNGRRTIALTGGSLRKTRAGQLIDAVHELSHARHSAKLGYQRYVNIYSASRANRGRIEVLVESRALKTVEKYLGGLTPQQWGWSSRYIEAWR